MTLSYALAVIGGLLMIFSPCSAMLLPSFFAYAFSATGTLISRTGLFFLGLITTLVPMGVASALIGSLVTSNQSTIVTVASIVIIVLGIVQALGVGFGPRARVKAGAGPLATYLLGTVYGIAGTCSGPILGSVLAASALGQSPLRGAIMLTLFAIGMTLPLLILALLWERLDLSRRSWLRPRPVTIGRLSTTVGNLVAGALFVAVGMLFLVTDGTANLGGLLGADAQQSLEQQVSTLLGSVPDVVTILVLFGLAALAVATHQLAKRRQATKDQPDAVDTPAGTD